MNDSASVQLPAAAGARLPCTPAQRRAWLLDCLDPGTPALNVPMRLRVEGRLDAATLRRALGRLVARHAELRTWIAADDGAPAQVVEPAASVDVTEVDLAARLPGDALAEAGRLAQAEARAPFDLTGAPLLRAMLVRLPQDAAILLLTAHRMIGDVFWLAALARELATILDGQAPQPERPAARPAPEATSADRDADEDYWRDALQALRPFALEPDHPRPAAQTSSAAIVSLDLEPEAVAQLREAAARGRAGLPAAMAAVLLALLHRYSGEDDIAIGSQLAGDDDPGWSPGTMVLRCALDGDRTFAALLERVRAAVAEGLKHSAMPLEQVIEMLEPVRDRSRHALFSIHVLFRSGVATAAGGAVRLVELPPCAAGTLYDLGFAIVEAEGRWRLSCEYNADLYAQPTVERMLAHFASLLRAAAAEPEQRVATLAMLGEAERHALVVDANRTDGSYPEHLTVAGLFEAQVQRTPNAEAVACGADRLDYRELDRAANRLARELQARGVGHGARVGIFLERSVDLLVALLGVLKSGAAYVPLDPAYPAARLAQIVGDARPEAMLTKEALREGLPAGAGSIVLLDGDAASIRRQSDGVPPSTARPGDIAYVIYTSGSTGRPKGVQVGHRGLTNLLWSMRRRPGIAASDTLVSVTTVSFDIAGLELFQPLVVGARVVIAQAGETADGASLGRLLQAQRATILQATPVTWQILLAAGWRPGPGLRMLCGGEALPRTVADALLQGGGELWNLYGPTETTIWSSALRVEAGSGPVPIGPPIDNTQFYVMDAHGQLAPTGAPGELWIGGDGVALGYLNLPELTAERFVPDPFRRRAGAKLYRTGDRVRRRERGTLEFLGRIDHQVKVRGVRIELGEIEAILRAHPAIADAVAVAVPDASGERALVAYVAARSAQADGGAALGAELRERVRQALPAAMCPSAIVTLRALPRLPNGKVDRAALPAPAPAGAPAAGRPLDEVEQRVARLWCEVLGVAAVDADANFFEIGGHSLLAVRLLARIEASFGRKLSLAALFDNATVAAQARLLEQASPRAFDFRQVVQLQPHGGRPPLIALNNTGIYYGLARRLGLDQPFTSLQLFDPSLPEIDLPGTLEGVAAEYTRLIRRVQPAGPYALLGWCVAGTLAFEVARQLTAAGEKVSQLILFDTLAPGYLRRLPWLRARLADYAYRWKLIVADWRRVRRGALPLSGFLAHRTIVRKLLRLLGSPRGEEAPAPPGPGQYDQWLLRYLERIAESYEPQPYAGAMTLFRSSQEPSGLFIDPEMGWGRFVAGGIEVVTIEGDHFGIFQEPSVSQVALRIQAAARARPAPRPAGGHWVT